MGLQVPFALFRLGIVQIFNYYYPYCSCFHTDIQFWRSRKSLEGLSVRSVFFNVFQSVIVLLYVWDNEANTIVIISCFVGLVIEIWKIHKVVDVTVSLIYQVKVLVYKLFTRFLILTFFSQIDRENPVLGFIPRVKIADKQSYTESSTRQYDTVGNCCVYLICIIYYLIQGNLNPRKSTGTSC